MKVYDAAISLLIIYPKEIKLIYQKDTGTFNSIAQLFTIAKKIWINHKYPPMDK